MRRGGRARVGVAALGIAAAVAVVLSGCAPATTSSRLSRCLPGTWTLQIDVVADRMTPYFVLNGTPVTSTGASGVQTLTIADDLHVQVDSDLVWTAAGTTDGSTLVVEQRVVGTRTAQAVLRDTELSYGHVRGLLDERMTARIDGEHTRHHYRVPSTAAIGRPGTVSCTDTTLTVERVAGVRLDFTRAG